MSLFAWTAADRQIFTSDYAQADESSEQVRHQLVEADESSVQVRDQLVEADESSVQVRDQLVEAQVGYRLSTKAIRVSNERSKRALKG